MIENEKKNSGEDIEAQNKSILKEKGMQGEADRCLRGESPLCFLCLNHSLQHFQLILHHYLINPIRLIHICKNPITQTLKGKSNCSNKLVCVKTDKSKKQIGETYERYWTNNKKVMSI